MKEAPSVVTPPGLRLESHEITAAWIIARHYRCVVEFLVPVKTYKTKTPDIVMKGIMWEMKSPQGASKKSTVEQQFKGLKQSRHLIIDGRRTKLDDNFVITKIRHEIRKRRNIKRTLYITKNEQIVVVRASYVIK